MLCTEFLRSNFAPLPAKKYKHKCLYVDIFVTNAFVSVMFKNGKYPPVDSRGKNVYWASKPFKHHHRVERLAGPRQTETSQATNKNTRNSNPRTREPDMSSAKGTNPSSISQLLTKYLGKLLRFWWVLSCLSILHHQLFYYRHPISSLTNRTK